MYRQPVRPYTSNRAEQIEPYADQDFKAIRQVGCSQACNRPVVLASRDLPEDVKRSLGPIR